MAAMGRVKDQEPASATKPAAKGQPAGRKPPGLFRQYLANLARGGTYKPSQGWHARLWTGLGLGVLIAAGLYQLDATQLQGETTTPARFGLLAILAAVLGWLVFRTIQFPPFADFLVATEAEMNKVSWTTKAELKRATVVVLTTVFLMALYLFGVDWLWSTILQAIGILRFNSGDFGSQAG
jgi:preprotein translocase subunit SecE